MFAKLANTSAWVSKWTSNARLPQVLECPSAQVHWVTESSSTLWVPKCLKCLSPDRLEYPSALGMPLEHLLSDYVPFEWPMSALWVPKCPLSALRVKKVCSITGNGLHNSFIESFKNLSEYMFCIIVIVFCFLGNKICKFCHVLLARYKSLKELSKTFVKYFELQSSLLRKIIVLQLECRVLIVTD